MNKVMGTVAAVAGIILLFAAVGLFLWNEEENRRAGQRAQEVLDELQQIVGQLEQDAMEQEPMQQDETTEEETLGIELDGEEYIGYLCIPKLELQLPVMSDWSYAKLKSTPCRQFGSAGTDDLVIAGHNYQKHFAGLASLDTGDAVSFHDMSGTAHMYLVEAVRVVDPSAVDQVQNSGCALVLYTCTYGGGARIAVFCQRAVQ